MSIARVLVPVLVILLGLSFTAEGITVKRVPEVANGKPTGWDLYYASVTAKESKALHSVWNYNLQLGRTVVDTIMAAMGAPRGVTATAAMAPTIGWATAKVGYDLWYWSLQNKGQAFTIGYRSNTQAAARLRAALGGAGDEIAPTEIELLVKIIQEVFMSPAAR